MKSFNKIIYSIVVFVGCFVSSIQAQVIAPYLLQLEYGTDIDYENPFVFVRNNLATDNLSGLPFFTSTPSKVKEIKNAVVDGYHLDSNGFWYFSFDVDTRIDNGGGVFLGQRVLKSDIIRCTNVDCSTFDYFFDSVTESFNHVNINAFTLDPTNGDLIFSIENDALINSVDYFASDLIRFDGTDYSLAYNSFSDSFSRYRNIDAVSLTTINKFLVSFANDPVTNDIYEYDSLSTNWSVAYASVPFGNDYNQVNISSLMVQIQPLPELLFADGFE